MRNEEKENVGHDGGASVEWQRHCDDLFQQYYGYDPPRRDQKLCPCEKGSKSILLECGVSSSGSRSVTSDWKMGEGQRGRYERLLL